MTTNQTSNLKSILNKLINNTLNLEDNLFNNIEEKKAVLSKYLNSDLANISYEPKRNLFIYHDTDEEYNVLTNEESDIQSFINMYHDADSDCIALNIHDAAALLNMPTDVITKTFNAKYSDSIQISDIISFIKTTEIPNAITIETLLLSLFTSLSRESFLSCDYEEIKYDNFYIYRYNN